MITPARKKMIVLPMYSTACLRQVVGSTGICVVALHEVMFQDYGYDKVYLKLLSAYQTDSKLS